MKIFVDADNCSKKIRDIIIRASERMKIDVYFVSNKNLNIPASEYIKIIKVGAGENIADKKIYNLVNKGDIVITADIPFTSKVLEKDAVAINPRGDLYTREDIKERLSMRNFLSNLRDMGLDVSSNKKKDSIKKFSDAFDRELAKALKISGK